MYIETVRNRNSPPAILLREGWREGKKVRKRTLANLSHLPKNIIELIRRALKGEAFVAVSEAFEVIKSSLHGHVNACRTTMRRLRFDKLLASKPCRERNLVEAMVAARILEPDSKLATTRWWHTTTLPESLGVADANEDDLYAAMDWLLERQERIEKKLAGRHLKKGGLVLYDLSSSYFEGVTCPLAAMGYSRDGKRDRLQVNYGLVTDERGCPVAVSVFAGNESDSTTLMPQVEMVRNRFGIKTLVLVGDRGMISQKRIDDDLRNLEGVDWITALKSASIRKLIDGGQLQLGLFDERNLFELTHPDFAGERLFACRNTELAKLRVHKRQSLLQEPERGGRKWKDKQAEQAATYANRRRIRGTRGKRLIRRRGELLERPFAHYLEAGGMRRTHLRRHENILKATARELARIQTMVQRARLRGKDKIGARVRKVVTKTLAKYFVLDIRDDDFTFQIPNKEVAAKAALDSIYKRLTKLRSNVELGNLKGKDKIRARVHKLITKKIAKHFDLDIRDDEFRFRIVEQEPAAEAVLNDICKRLESIRSDVKLGKHGGKDNIGVRVGKVINKYKVAKHFVLQIRDDGFDFHIDEHKVASEATLDGIYVIRTSVPEQRLSPDDTVRCYKSLSQVERAFRSIKTIDLKVRPIRHRLETRVRAHIFLCMLAYYVEWHMREAWRPLLFCDEDQEAKKTRDPVAPAKRSEAALRKIRSKKLDDGTEAHSFQTLLKALSTIVRNICRAPGDNPDAPTFQVVTTPDPKQQRAYDLLETIIL